MRLLIVTQAVDTEDTTLGFFHRWIEEFAAHAEHVDVICLKAGKSDLPGNVSVHSLGKSRSAESAKGAGARIRYAVNFYRHIWRLRRGYDAVFVHMNEEYAYLGGLVWRMLGKKVVLWRNHKAGSWRTRLAVAFSGAVCYTSPRAFVARSAKAVRMPIGIDTDMFAPPPVLPPQGTILFLGRLDRVKRPDIFLKALAILAERGVAFKASLCGSPTDPQAEEVRAYAALAAPLVERGALALISGVPHDKTPALYRAAAVYVNLTPPGSFDKTIGEAMASGCIVVCANDAVRSAVPAERLISGDDPQEAARALEAALRLPAEARALEARALRAYIEREHSLDALFRALGILLGRLPV